MWYQNFIEQHIANTTPSWLQQFKQKNAERFIEAGFPTRKQENWKYTSLIKLTDTPFYANKESLITHQIEQYKLSDDFLSLVFVNGKFAANLSDSCNDDNIIITSMCSALEKHPELIQKHLNNIADDQHAMLTFNNAVWQDGLFIYLPKNSRLEKPLHALFIADQENLLQCYRHLVICEENTQLSLLEHYVGSDDIDYLTSAHTEIMAGKNSIIHHYRHQAEGHQAQHIAGLHWHQQQGSQCTSYNIALGSALDRYDIHSMMDAEHTFCDMQGVYLANNSQLLDTHTRVDHLQPHSTSNEHYKGIAGDRAQAVFNGKVIVHNAAQKTEAAQSNNNLLLTKTAEIDTKPELEIYADDVKCSHGTTVGELDADALFFLRSRGLDKQTAQLMLTSAFTDEVTNRIPNDTIKQFVYQQIHQKLEIMLG